MDIDAGKYGEESILSFIADTHLMKMIVIQYTVIDAFCTSPVLIDLFPFVGSVEKRAAITGIVTVIDIDDSAIIRRTAQIFVITVIDLPHRKRTSELMSAALNIIAKIDHFKACITDWDTIL